VARGGDRGEVELNLTPMIDVVFNLIVFFMLITDLTQKDLDAVTLPRAERSTPDLPPDLRVIVNVTKAEDWARTGDVRVRVGGRDLSPEGLRDLLYRRAELDRPEAGGPSEVPVLIRCDADVRWREVQWVMQACAKRPARIYRIQFATAKGPAR